MGNTSAAAEMLIAEGQEAHPSNASRRPNAQAVDDLCRDRSNFRRLRLVRNIKSRLARAIEINAAFPMLAPRVRGASKGIDDTFVQ